MNSPEVNTLAHLMISSKDVKDLRSATTFVLNNCIADEWPEVAKSLASLIDLRHLTLMHCKIGNSLFWR